MHRPALPLRIDGTRPCRLLNTAATRRWEQQALTAQPGPGALMETAGLTTARWVQALTPHAPRIVVLAGPGNNGGDGLVAARHLHGMGLDVQVVLTSTTERLPADAARAAHRAIEAGVRISPPDEFLREISLTPPCSGWTLVDALLGLGQTRAPSGTIGQLVDWANSVPHSHRLAIDIPTGLCADTGQAFGPSVFQARATLTLLSLKPGLFTGQGRDLAGEVWWDDLDAGQHLGPIPEAASIQLSDASWVCRTWPLRAHGQHKGSFGDVWVIGGATGMEGAAHLAARAALRGGGGRVYLNLLGEAAPTAGTDHPELMHRRLGDWQQPGVLENATAVCGCGGGASIGPHLAEILSRSARLVLDADALNALATSPALQSLLTARTERGLGTILTPHPLEAARLAGVDSPTIQADRLHWARSLAGRFNATVLLKGSGTVIADPQGRCWINSTGHARLATPGSGDVLAGWIGAAWTQAAGRSPRSATDIAAAAAWVHGAAAGPAPGRLPITASALIQAMAEVVEHLPGGPAVTTK